MNASAHSTERDGEAVQQPAGAERIGYLDGVDFQHHVGNDAHPVRLYSSVETCLAGERCAAECGVVRVRIIEDAWIVPQDFKTLYTLAETQRSSSEPASQMNPKSNPEQE